MEFELKLCDEKGVTLKIGPTFLAEIRKFESEDYYTYLRHLVDVSGIYHAGKTAITKNDGRYGKRKKK